MASQFKNDLHTIPTAKARQYHKKAKAKRALRSLAISIMVPFSLTLTLTLFLPGSTQFHKLHNGFPPFWLMHLASLGSASLMGLAAWLVWAEGGFHGAQSGGAFHIYIAEIFLGLVWGPLGVGVGPAGWVGLGLCLGHLGTLLVCHKRFRIVNPFAADLVKPCLAWVVYITFVNFKVVCL